MSFAFSFNGDDYSDEEQEQDTLCQSTQSLSIENGESVSIPAQRHELRELLEAMPLTLAYATLSIDDTRIPRRTLWDIKHQLMSGSTDDRAESEAQEEAVLGFMGSDDVIKGTYEGGFKTWECSIDLCSYVTRDVRNVKSVLELGCGSALPSIQTFRQALDMRRPLKLVVQDYNLPVLQYSTIPNLFLAWVSLQRSDWEEEEGEISVTERLKAEFLQDLQEQKVKIVCVSGSWSREMTSIIGPVDMVLASETIYERRNLAAFTSTMKACMGRDGIALVAAKSMYFGVGGGVEEFSKELNLQGMTWNHVFASEAGVKRTILQVKQN